MKILLKLFVAIMAISVLNGCVTTSGNYVVIPTDGNGKNLNPKMVFNAKGSGIYSARNAICSQYKGATVIIKDIKTNKELEGESPYKCSP